MSASVLPPVDLLYPESDGAPLGENTRQVQAIVALYDGFLHHFHRRKDVFVASDLFWYPVEGKPKVVHAPDVLFAFGRPSGHRRSYKQWEEGDTPPQVVVEVLSPSDKPKVRERKRAFYETHGVEEYVEYDPEREVMRVWTRTAGGLTPVEEGGTFLSPRLGVTLSCPGGAPLRVIRPDGTMFLTYHELAASNQVLQQRETEARAKATEARRAATEARGQAVAERQKADAERQKADAERQKADAERHKADAARHKADALAARLRALGHDPDA